MGNKVKQLRNAIVQTCISNGIPCSDMCSCRHKFCENNDSKKILEHVPATEKIISMIKKERTTNSYLHIYVNCLLAVSVCFLFVYILRRTHNL